MTKSEHYRLADAPVKAASGVPGTPTPNQKAGFPWQSMSEISSDIFYDLTVADSKTLLHNLQVHQIELELQNEVLRDAKDTLDASRTRYVDLYDNAPVGYCNVNEAGLITKANLTLSTLLGVIPKALAEKLLFTNFVHQEDQDIWYLLHKQLLTSGMPQTGELRLLQARAGSVGNEGASVWVQIVATVKQDDTDWRVLHIAVSDISARKRAQALQMESEARWKFAVDGAGDGLWDWNIQTGQAFFSTRYKEMLGYAEGDIGTTLDEWTKRIHPDDAPSVYAALQPFIDGKPGSVTVEFRMLHRDGDWRWVLGRGMVVVRDALGKPLRMIGTNSDITERKMAQAELLAAKAEAELANQAKSRFLAAASHDLRQPLAALTLYVDVLKGRATVRDSSLVSKIEACCVSLTDLLTDLLDMSKLDAGVVLVKVSDFAVDDLLKSIATVHSAEANIKGLQLRVRPSPGVIVRTDLLLMTRILGNLIANAICYTNHGGILVACRHRAGALLIEVWDTGVGIPADKTGQVFQEFMQLDEAPSRAGSGLGLSIVAKTAALLGLPVRVRSKLGQGSVFSIELPAGRASAITASLPYSPPTRPLLIGLVEDDAQVAAAMVLALESAGHEVIATMTGKELLTRLGQRAPDIVISDYRLAAGKNGFDVVKATRAVFGNTLPALLITGDTDPVLMRSMAGHGISIHYKPLRMDSLQLAISHATERRA